MKLMKLMKLPLRGFTLIELLVVIAIISLLSSIVMASLGTARQKAKDAAIKEEMVALRTEAELDYKTSDGTYTTNICAASVTGGFLRLLTAIGEKTPTINSYTCAQNVAFGGSRPTAWGAAVNLNDGQVFCVDSSGKTAYSLVSPQLANREIDVNGAAPTADFVCNDL